MPLAGLVVLGAASVHLFEGNTTAVLHASQSFVSDFDYDGLTNDAERVLGSSPYNEDSDGDGFGDNEEFARGSATDNPANVPLPSLLALNMSASGEHDGLHLQIAMFYTDGELRNKLIQLGIATNGEVRILPAALKAPEVTSRSWTTLDGQNDVLVIDVPFPENLVHSLGTVSIFTILSIDGTPTIAAAAGIDLASIEGVVTLVSKGPSDRLKALQAQSGSGPNPGGPSSGSVYQPIPPGGGGNVPLSWSPGSICFQATLEISMENGIVTHEVIAADCISDAEASCPPSCPGSVGEVFETFDPIGLIGG